MKIMFDMDGVLCDFVYWIEYNHVSIEEGKANWDKVVEMGPSFWSNMPWKNEGRRLYDFVLNYVKEHADVEIGIHSGILWKTGKIYWVKANCPEIDQKNVKIDDNGHIKHLSGQLDEILVDDQKENVNKYIEAGFPAVLFSTAEETFKNIKILIEKLKKQ